MVPSTNVYIVFRLDLVGGDVKYDGDEISGAGFFTADEMANMERVQGLSTWAIQKALATDTDSGLHLERHEMTARLPGWGLFGLRAPVDLP